MLSHLMHFNAAAVTPWNLGFSLVYSCNIGIVAVMKVLDQYMETASAIPFKCCFLIESLTQYCGRKNSADTEDAF